MPSLRRAISSPSVRSSPYPALSNASNAPLGVRGNGHRRSSGSETSTRRVLADIEWWRVTDGQHDTDADQESEDSIREAFDSPLGRSLALEELLGNVALGVDHPTIVPLVVGAPEPSQALPTGQFAALSISPQTPPRRQHSRQTSASSVDSSLVVAEPATFEGLRLSVSDVQQASLVPDFPVLRRTTGTAVPLFALRTHSLGDFMSFDNESANEFADFTVSPLSASLDLYN